MILIIAAVIGLIGAAYFYYKKKKKDAEGVDADGNKIVDPTQLPKKDSLMRKLA